MKTIVLVEDDPAIQDVFQLALKVSPYSVVIHDSGEAILRNEAVVPDIFMLDKNISGTNGLDLCRFIKSSAKYKHVATLILSAAPDIARTAREAGADGYLAKPFSLRELRETIDKYMPTDN